MLYTDFTQVDFQNNVYLAALFKDTVYDMKYVRLIGKRKDLTLFILLSVFSLFATWISHKGRDRFDWLSELYADKAGYYIYLPATFIYQFDFNKVPKGIDVKTGYGFVCNPDTKKIYTHFYYGEALLISPFFLATHAASKVFNIDEEGGFSYPYHRIFNFASVFYFLLGIWFLRKFLAKYFSQNLAWFVILITFVGTNLMYYTLEDTLMSHVYSFSTAAIFLFLTKKFIDDMTGYKWFLLMSLAFAVMFVIRPTNSILGSAFLFLDIRSGKDIVQRLKVLFNPKHILVLLILIFILSFPQLLYWRYLYDSWTIPSYGGAGFGNWDQPRFAEVWFSTVNGLIPYSPVILFFVAGMIFMILKRIPNGIFILVLFLIVSYIAAAWKNWYWGCAFGHRAFVEYYSLFCLPFGFLMQETFNNRKKRTNIVLIILVSYFTYFSFLLTGSVLLKKNGKCFFGSTWDFGEYSRVLSRAGLIWPFTGSLTYTNDYENEEEIRGSQITEQIAHSGFYSVKADPRNEFCAKFSRMMWEFGTRYPGQVHVKLWLNMPFAVPTGAMIVFSIEKDHKSASWQACKLDQFALPVYKWIRVETTFNVPEKIPGDYMMLIYIWNPGKKVLYADDLNISFDQ